MRRVCAVSLVVPDYQSGLDFYVGVMGFHQIKNIDMGNGKRWVTVSPKGAETALILARASSDKQSAAIGNQTGGRVGFFLETDDFARDHAAMLAAGVTFEEDPRDEVYGKVAVWRDPFGNRWDLVEYKT